MGRSWPGSLLWGPLGARSRVQGRRRTERSAQPAPRLVSASWMSGVAGSSRAVAPSLFQEAGGAPSPATRVGSPACLSAPTGIGEAAAPSKVRTLGPGPRACPRGAVAAGTTAWPEPASALPCAASGTPPPPLAALRVSARAAGASAGPGGRCHTATWLVVPHTGPHASPSRLDRARAQAAVRRGGAPPLAPRRATVPRAPPRRAASWTSSPRSPPPARRESPGRGGRWRGALRAAVPARGPGAGPLGCAPLLPAHCCWGRARLGQDLGKRLCRRVSHS